MPGVAAKRKILLLGMVYSVEEKPKRGQEFRDRVRCESLENFGFDVYTLDNKHLSSDLDECKKGKHCTANFCDFRRMQRSIIDTWGNIQFDCIILDYFFSPVMIITFIVVDFHDDYIVDLYVSDYHLCVMS